jgi:hypothetical protein
VRAARISVFLMSLGMLTACDTISNHYQETGVTRAECAEIGQALRAVTLSPVKDCYQTADPNTIVVGTKDGEAYQARKIKGKWHFKAHAILVTQRSNQAMKLTATTVRL